MTIKEYKYMHDDIVDIRTEVFVVEQDFKEEFDDIDNNCTFLAMYDSSVENIKYKGKAVAMCRFFSVDDETYAIGRIAVRADYRGKGIGSIIVRAAEERVRALGASWAVLSAQLRAEGFYKKLGYVSEGEIYYEEWCEHIKMRKNLCK